MPKLSAGIVLYRKAAEGYEVLIVHPGGPFWAKKDLESWSIPKGEFEPGEDPLAAARREFREETGLDVEGEFVALDPVRQAGGKVVQFLRNILRIEHRLGAAFAVANINENKAAEIAAGMNPAGERDALANVRRAQFVAMMCAFHSSALPKAK